MLHNLFKKMADDMGISWHANDELSSYSYRIIYSALGLWCLHSGLNHIEETNGATKQAQTRLLKDLLDSYCKLAPEAEPFLRDGKKEIAPFIRNVYEETGYFLTDGNINRLNNGGESIQLAEEKHLYLGLPNGSYVIDGLGVHTSEKCNPIFLNDFLIRDELKPNEFVERQFDLLDFEPRSFPLKALEFFNVHAKKYADAWQPKRMSDMTLARLSEQGPYYKVLQTEEEGLLFQDLPKDAGNDKMSGREYKRLQIALRHVYQNPVKAKIVNIDRDYIELDLYGTLPNREYYFLLLNGWPKEGFTDRLHFILPAHLKETCAALLKNLGMSIEGEMNE